jgi:Fe-S-cluster containining protein
MPSQNQDENPASGDDSRQTIVDAVLNIHNRLNANTTKILESASFVYALVELLGEKGVLTKEELSERKGVVENRLAAEFRAKGMGAMLQEPEYDKYTFEASVEIDCKDRIHLCKAACCRLPFALSMQDIREGKINWHLGRPYMIEQREDGYCTHFEGGTCGCTVYENRPVPCRAFDCRNDKRIWVDFEKRIPHPSIDSPEWMAHVAREAKEEEKEGHKS